MCEASLCSKSACRHVFENCLLSVVGELAVRTHARGQHVVPVCKDEHMVKVCCVCYTTKQT